MYNPLGTQEPYHNKYAWQRHKCLILFCINMHPGRAWHLHPPSLPPWLHRPAFPYSFHIYSFSESSRPGPSTPTAPGGSMTLPAGSNLSLRKGTNPTRSGCRGKRGHFRSRSDSTYKPKRLDLDQASPLAGLKVILLFVVMPALQGDRLPDERSWNQVPHLNDLPQTPPRCSSGGRRRQPFDHVLHRKKGQHELPAVAYPVFDSARCRQ